MLNVYSVSCLQWGQQKERCLGGIAAVNDTRSFSITTSNPTLGGSAWSILLMLEKGGGGACMLIIWLGIEYNLNIFHAFQQCTDMLLGNSIKNSPISTTTTWAVYHRWCYAVSREKVRDPSLRELHQSPLPLPLPLPLPESPHSSCCLSCTVAANPSFPHLLVHISL